LYVDSAAGQPDPLKRLADDLAELRAEVASLRHELRPRRGARGQLLSLREAARRLGIDRGATLATLLETRQIRGTKVNGRVRIPASEVDRLVRDGFDTTQY
jgi:excisionase family DNA binding protein